MFPLGLYSHSPTLSFLFWVECVNSYCSFRQEMPNGFPKTYSWHGNEIQICKTFLTWKKEKAARGNGFVLFGSAREYTFAVTRSIPNVISKWMGGRHKAKELKPGNNWGIYWSVTDWQNRRVDGEHGSVVIILVFYRCRCCF